MCVQGAYVYCMYRQSESQLVLDTGSVQMEDLCRGLYGQCLSDPLM